jgi:hypothetical protein
LRRLIPERNGGFNGHSGPDRPRGVERPDDRDPCARRRPAAETRLRSFPGREGGWRARRAADGGAPRQPGAAQGPGAGEGGRRRPRTGGGRPGRESRRVMRGRAWTASSCGAGVASAARSRSPAPRTPA